MGAAYGKSGGRTYDWDGLGSQPPDDDMFTARERKILQETFEDIKKNRETFAAALLHRVSLIEGVSTIYERGRQHKIGNSWSDVDLGTILMNGIERCLLRIGSRSALVNLCKRMTASHIKDYNVKSAMMMAALYGCQEVFSREFIKRHDHADPDRTATETTNDKLTSPDRCEICLAWQKFFGIVLDIFATC